ncbi:hypothetical protein N7510_006193 [Penicillium lagena]|uniref:uncharacterized protein n=1 Tax=Penicillium lagena TaxID=94218 RepID=UPI00254212B4|nr:uncharacterized protein N7510_006193 [Penicillium lagena]KAJ5612999.1 hypothetical protein N7510_006193 [Penicillium lagena]
MILCNPPKVKTSLIPESNRPCVLCLVHVIIATVDPSWPSTVPNGSTGRFTIGSEQKHVPHVALHFRGFFFPFGSFTRIHSVYPDISQNPYLGCSQNCMKSAENGPSMQNKFVPNRSIGKPLQNCMTRNKDSLARQASGACPRKAWVPGTTVSSPTIDSERFGIVKPGQTEIGSSAGDGREASHFRIAYGESQPLPTPNGFNNAEACYTDRQGLDDPVFPAGLVLRRLRDYHDVQQSGRCDSRMYHPFQEALDRSM